MFFSHGTWRRFLTEADWSASPSSMLFRFSHWLTPWISAFAFVWPSTIYYYLEFLSNIQSYKTGSSAESSEEKSPATPNSATSTEGSTNAPPPPPPAPPTVVVTPATGSDSTVVSPGGQNTTSSQVTSDSTKEIDDHYC